MALTKCKTGTLEIVRIASRCWVSHVSEFALITEVTHVEHLFENWIVKDKIAVEESVVRLEKEKNK